METDDEGRVTAFVEKPTAEKVTPHYINAGVYIMEPSIFDRMPPGRAFSVERDRSSHTEQSWTAAARNDLGASLVIAAPSRSSPVEETLAVSPPSSSITSRASR